jgi:predicted adenine nucleotide alpha hydrolase (AANH) superfamily ATPase
VNVLLHICCAPCSIVPIDRLRAERMNVRGFWLNPNIHPYTEYEKRREAVAAYCRAVDLAVEWRGEYALQEFLRAVAFRETDRCRVCLNLRLGAAAQAAREGGFDAFSTTLLYSRRQPHDLIREVGESIGRTVGIEFLYRDFRSGWREGIERSKALGIYRQKYCGCVYSERDRFLRPSAEQRSVAETTHP